MADATDPRTEPAGPGLPSGLRSVLALLGAGAEAVQRRIGRGIELVLGALVLATAPVRSLLGGGPASGVRRRAGAAGAAARSATGASAVWTHRRLATALPAVPAPTFRLRDGVTVAPRHVAGGLGLVGLLAVPRVLTAFELSDLIFPVYLMVFAMSWDVVSGYTGQISLGHSAFFALGGYATTVLNLQHGLSPLLSIPAGVAVAALGGLVIGFPALRIRGPYLSLVTLIAPLILLQLVILFNNNLPYLAPSGLGGVNGFVAQNQPLFGTGPNAVVRVTSYPWQTIFDYYLAVALLVAVFAVLYVITRSGTGDVLTAIREDESTVESVGLDAAKFKLFAFVLSGAVGGLAGALFVHSSVGNPLNPAQILFIGVSIEVVIVAIIGGMGTIIGPAAGAVFFVAGTVLIASYGGEVVVPVLGESLAALMPAPLFIAALLLLVYRPQGLVPTLVDAGRWLAASPEERLSADREEECSPLEQTLRSYRRALER